MVQSQGRVVQMLCKKTEVDIELDLASKGVQRELDNMEEALKLEDNEEPFKGRKQNYKLFKVPGQNSKTQFKKSKICLVANPSKKLEELWSNKISSPS